MQIKYVPSQLDLSSCIPNNDKKKEEQKQQVQFVLNSLPNALLDSNKRPPTKKKTIESTWGYKEEDMEEYPEDSPKLYDKYQQL
jgi:hypothetical protein